MNSIIQSPPAYARRNHHPLASALLAILWATLLMLGVKGYCAMQADAVMAGEGVEAVEEPQRDAAAGSNGTS